MKFITSFSGGKDSMLALDRMIRQGHSPVGLFVSASSEKKSWYHDINRELMEKIAESLQIPLFFVVCLSGEQYSVSFEKEIKKIILQTNAEAIVFGDIDLQMHQDWCLERCNNLQIKGIFPLWQENRKLLVLEFIQRGYQAVIKKVRKKELASTYLGKILNEELVYHLESIGVDACGENGEYHTVVFDGPLFKQKIQVKTGKILDNGISAVLEVRVL